MDLCLLRFALPFNLCLPDGKCYYFREAGQLVTVRTSTRLGSRILNYERDSTDWIGKEKAEIHDGQPQSPETRVMSFKIFEPIKDFSGGIVVDTDYTVLDLIFEDITGAVLHTYKEWAIGVVRGFVDKFRIAANRGWIGEFGRTMDIQVILGGKAHDAILIDGSLTAEFDTKDTILELLHPSLYGRRQNPLNADELAAFESRLASHQGIALHESLFLEAAVQNVQHKNHDLAIVHIETAFEVFLQSLLIDHCERNPTLVLPGNKAQTQGNQVAIEEGNIQNDLFRFVNHISNIDVKISQEYNKWYNDAYLKRNRIVHRGERGATESEVVKAGESTQQLMEYLKTLIP